jgi:hypothetical protein
MPWILELLHCLVTLDLLSKFRKQELLYYNRDLARMVKNNFHFTGWKTVFISLGEKLFYFTGWKTFYFTVWKTVFITLGEKLLLFHWVKKRFYFTGWKTFLFHLEISVWISLSVCQWRTFLKHKQKKAM